MNEPHDPHVYMKEWQTREECREVDGLTRAYTMGKEPTDLDKSQFWCSSLMYISNEEFVALRSIRNSRIEFKRYLDLLLEKYEGLNVYIHEQRFRCGKTRWDIVIDSINRGIRKAGVQLIGDSNFIVPNYVGQSIVDTIHEKMFFGEGVGKPTGIINTVASWTANDVINNIKRDNE